MNEQAKTIVENKEEHRETNGNHMVLSMVLSMILACLFMVLSMVLAFSHHFVYGLGLLFIVNGPVAAQSRNVHFDKQT